MIYEIKKWTDGSTIYKGGAESLEALVMRAVKEGVSLNHANLNFLNFPRGTTFVGTRFVGTRFDGTTFDGTTFVGTTFVGTTFVGTTFDGTTFDEISLREIIRTKALNPVKADIYLILLRAIPEVPFLRQALIDGKVDGSTYEGECACLCGTIANARHCDFRKLEGIQPDSKRPAEDWFKGIRKGDTPESSQVAKITLDWIDEFLTCIAK